MCFWTSDGHCVHPLRLLKESTTKILDVHEDIIEKALTRMLTGGQLILEEIDDEPLVFLPYLRRAEVGTATIID